MLLTIGGGSRGKIEGIDRLAVGPGEGVPALGTPVLPPLTAQAGEAQAIRALFDVLAGRYGA